MIKWESINENFKRGWVYAIISMFIYYFLALLPGLVRAFDIYFFLLRGAISAILSLSFLFFFLTLVLGSVSRSLEKKEISNIMKKIVVTVIGVAAIFVSSFFILGLILRLGG